MTRVVLAYLADWRDGVAVHAFDHFKAGTLTALLEHEARGRYLCADDIVHLEWASVLKLYGLVPPTEETTEP